MKKLFLKSVLLIFFTTCVQSAFAAEYDAAASKIAAQNDVQNWMKYLPDNVYVAHVSIPGTHDTATAEGWKSATGSTMSTTQEKTIDEQLARGIRAFDFRPGLVNDELWCNHGTDQTNLKLADAFAKLKNFLDTHPSEFFVMHLFRGNVYRSGDASWTNKLIGAKDDTASQNKYNELFNALFNTGEFADYFIDYSPYLKVGDVRGKIIVFRRDRIDFAHIAKAGNLENWPGSEENWTEDNYVTVTNASDPTIKGILRATDVSSPDNEDQLNIELNSITNLFNYNCNQTLPNDAKREGTYKPYWSMIFTSGAYDGENTSGYKKNASYTNPHLTQLIKNAEKKGPTGIVLSDWVLTDNYDAKGVELVPTIYLNNFDYIDNYILDEDLFADTVAENYWEEGKEYFLKNVATGELLSSGADWGTHAVLNKYGIRIKIHFDQANNLYQLTTTQNNGGIGGNYYVDNGSPAFFEVKKSDTGKFAFLLGENALTAKTHSNQYADGTKYLVDGDVYQDGNEFQQWEVISVEDYFKNQIAKASKDNGVDISYMIRGFRFLPNDTENDNAWTWTDTGGEDGFISKTHYGPERQYDGTNIQTDKDLFFKGYNKSASGKSKYMEWTNSQKIENLPDGIYSVHANIANLSGTNFSFKVNDNEIPVNQIASSGTMNGDEIISMFRNGEHSYGIDNLVVTDGTIEIVFHKKGTASETMVAVDNLNLIYYGLPEQEVVWTMEGAKYDTLILPFDADVPENMTIYNAYSTDGKDYQDYNVLELVETDRIVANTPYIVKRTVTSADTPALRKRGAAKAVAMDENTFSFSGVPSNDADEYTEGLLTGTLADKALPSASGHFVLTHEADKSYFALHTDTNQLTVAANHAYIDTSNAETLGKSTLHFEAQNQGEATGIDELSNMDSAESMVDVFTTSGVLVRSNVKTSEALDTLAPGIYILSNGKHLLKTAK